MNKKRKTHKAHKVKIGQLLGSVLKRMVHPGHASQAIKLQRGNKALKRSINDPELRLFSKLLPSGFLHYGYFDDPDTQPQEMSLNDIQRAQHRYCELILDNIVDRDSPVLDVGCGMGGLTKLMLEQGLNPVALSPNHDQISHIQSTYAEVPTIEARLEDIPVGEHSQRYGTIITAESLQYLKLDVALPLIQKLLKPGGRWIACDYFRIGVPEKRSEHWDDFEKRIDKSVFQFVVQRDITPNVLPTIRFVHMWGNDIARPILNFSLEKLQTKQPGVHYLLEDAVATINRKVDVHLDVVDPSTFSDTSKYMLLVMERAN